MSFKNNCWQPGPKDKSQRCDIIGKRKTLKVAGISKDKAHRAEQIAAIPDEEFESYLADKKAKDGKAVLIRSRPR